MNRFRSVLSQHGDDLQGNPHLRLLHAWDRVTTSRMFQTVAIAEFACFNRVRAHRIFVWWLRSFLRQNSLSNKSRSIFTQHILLTGLGETASSASQYSRREHRFFLSCLVWCKLACCAKFYARCSLSQNSSRRVWSCRNVHEYSK